MWSLQVCVCDPASAALDHVCQTCPAAELLDPRYGRSSFWDVRAFLQWRRAGRLCFSFFFPQPNPGTGYFFCRYCSFFIAHCVVVAPRRAPTRPNRSFPWDSDLRTNAANENREVPGNNHDNMGRWSGKMRVLSRIPPTHQAVMCSQAERKFADQFFFHVCDATTVTFCSSRDNDATVLVICVSSCSSSSAFFCLF